MAFLPRFCKEACQAMKFQFRKFNRSFSTCNIVGDVDRMKVFELGAMCSIPMALNAAVKLQVPEILSKAGEHAMLSAYEIAAQIPGCKAPEAGGVHLERILRLLASRGIFKEEIVQEQRKYGWTRACSYLVENENGGSLAHWVLFNQDVIPMKTWQFLHEAVLDSDKGADNVFTKAHGKQVFDLTHEDPRLNKLLYKTIFSYSKLLTQAIANAYDGFKGVKTLVDVGGGVGSCLQTILAPHPEIKGINFDLPHVISKAPTYANIEHVEGDMFQSVPEGDAILMKWILHNWDDEACIKLLRNCYRSLPDNGKVVVVDSVVPMDAGDAHSLRGRCTLIMDMLMLGYAPGGKERSYKEFIALGKGAGFTRIEIAATVDFLYVIEFYKG